MVSDNSIIVADIGGTNARFAIAAIVNGEIELSFKHTFPSRHYASFELVLKHYISHLPSCPNSISVAIAGPIDSDTVTLTNLDWSFSAQRLRNEFNFVHCKLINDFAAFAKAAPFINIENNYVIKQQKAKQGNLLVLGAGTGFGVASLNCEGRHNRVISSEAGHMLLAPRNNYEQALVNELSAMTDHVSIESVLSGNGLERLYLCIANLEQVHTLPLSAAQITDSALEGDELCIKTIEQFLTWLASVCGDLALAFKTQGGVYIGGGIVPRLKQFIDNSKFCEVFTEKGKMKRLLLPVSITLITQADVAFLGAAQYHIEDTGE